MSKRMIIMTGPFGAPIVKTAKELAAAEGLTYVNLDEEIVKRDGRSVLRLVMMNGEHGYRNAEYEVLAEICADPERFFRERSLSPNSGGVVIACGDGVLYDEDSREIALKNELVILGKDMTEDELWNNAKAATDSYHAFMHFGDEEERRSAFGQMICRQRALFDSIRAGRE